MSVVVATPLYGVDPDQPPIYGFLPYGKYDRYGKWVVTTPCQPSIIPVRDTLGRSYYIFEHPPGMQVAGKNHGYGLTQKARNVVNSVERSAHDAVNQITTGFNRTVKKIFG
jgi:hypothetical protein